MKLIDMKQKAKKTEEMKPIAYEQDKYPYDLQIRLDNESLGKLGIDVKKLLVGDDVTVYGVGKIIHISSNAKERNTSNDRLEIQIQKLSLSISDKKELGNLGVM